MPRLRTLGNRVLKQVLARIEQAVYREVAPLSVTAWVTREPVAYADRTSGRKRTLSIGESWGELFDCAWFYFQGQVPTEARGERVVLLIDVGGEACVVNERGEPMLGLTNINSEYDYSLGTPGKRVVPVTRRARGGEVIDVWADAGANDLFGKQRDGGGLKQACIAVERPAMLQLRYDFEVLEELARQLPDASAWQQQILTALHDVADLLVDYSDDEARRACSMLAPLLARRSGDAPLEISAVGHAHMDLAWLWPTRETVRKCARTFATALRMMERYPDYIFGASQPQQYAWVKQACPSLYRQIRKRVKEGRWDIQGSMWVESDTNLTSGESLVRQFLHGQRFWRQEFDACPRELWLPDVFGYSGALPQIMKKCGVQYFMTQKLSWNEVNAFPHQSFWWEGIDGSRVLAHMLPEENVQLVGRPARLGEDGAQLSRCGRFFAGADALWHRRRRRRPGRRAPRATRAAEEPAWPLPGNATARGGVLEPLGT